MSDIKTVCFVGAGTMGCFNSLLAAMAGYEVVLYDISADTLASVPEQHQQMATMMMAHGLCTPEHFADAQTRIRVNSSLESIASSVDLVSESIAESLEAKRSLHASLEVIFPPQTILTTNTSALLVSDIESALVNGEQFAAMHSHLGSPLIDIVAGPRTSPEVIVRLEQYVLSLQCVPLVLQKEHPGYVLNAMLGSVLATSMALVIYQLSSIHAVDQAWMASRSSATGPFGMMDFFGLNVIHDSWRYKEPGTPELAALKNSIVGFLQPYIDGNTLGVKSGQGFYSYPDAEFQQENFSVDSDQLARAQDALTCVLIVNAIAIVDKGVVSRADLDRAWKVGMTLAEGPFEALEALGTDVFLALLAQQQALGFCVSEDAERAKAYIAKGREAHV